MHFKRRCDGHCIIFARQFFSHLTIKQIHSNVAVTPTHRCICKYWILLHLIVLFSIHLKAANVYSIVLSYRNHESIIYHSNRIGYFKHVSPKAAMYANSYFSRMLIGMLMYCVIASWLVIFLLCSGDVHPNPGPSSSSSSLTTISSSSSSMSSAVFNSLTLNHNLSFVHYNVQSILPKLDLLHAELIEFDILAFSETWLHPDIDTDNRLLEQYQVPERKDRNADNHGGVIIYIKEGIHYKRRADLEVRDLENIWIEVANNHKRILFGLFYRPPNVNADYFFKN